jgi:hypothetical protein
MAEDFGFEMLSIGIPIEGIGADTMAIYAEAVEKDIGIGYDSEEAGEGSLSTDLNQRDRDFIDSLSLAERFSLMMTANFMDDKLLLDVLSKNIASEIKNTSPDQLKSKFAIKCSMSLPEDVRSLGCQQ